MVYPLSRNRTLLPGDRRPAVIDSIAHGATPRLVWRNVLGGQTWRIGDTYLKWAADDSGVDLRRETARLRWLDGRHPAPRVLGEGESDGGHWFTTAAVEGESAVDDRWRADPPTAIRAIAEGLRQMHALPISDMPPTWTSWVTRTPPALGPRPPLDYPVVVHGDACAPNTVLDAMGRFAASVDVGDLAVGDRWADLAVATMSLEWNYGPGWERVLTDAYGIAPDPVRIDYYRALWHAES